MAWLHNDLSNLFAQLGIFPTLLGETMIARAIWQWIRASATDSRKTSKTLRMDNLLMAMWSSTKSPRMPHLSASCVMNFGCPSSPGISVQLALESLSSFAGIRTNRLRLEHTSDARAPTKTSAKLIQAPAFCLKPVDRFPDNDNTPRDDEARC